MGSCGLAVSSPHLPPPIRPTDQHEEVGDRTAVISVAVAYGCTGTTGVDKSFIPEFAMYLGLN